MHHYEDGVPFWRLLLWRQRLQTLTGTFHYALMCPMYICKGALCTYVPIMCVFAHPSNIGLPKIVKTSLILSELCCLGCSIMTTTWDSFSRKSLKWYNLKSTTKDMWLCMGFLEVQEVAGIIEEQFWAKKDKAYNLSNSVGRSAIAVDRQIRSTAWSTEKCDFWNLMFFLIWLGTTPDRIFQTFRFLFRIFLYF